MSNYATLKAAVQAVVKSNGNKEITGTNMQSTLLGMITSLASGYLFKGVATPSTSVGTPDENVFYLTGAGTFANMGDTTYVPDGSIGIFMYNGSWRNVLVNISAFIEKYADWKVGYISQDMTPVSLDTWRYADIAIDTTEIGAILINADASGVNAYCYLLDGGGYALLSWNNVTLNTTIDLNSYPTAARLLVCSRASYPYKVAIYYNIGYYVTRAILEYNASAEDVYNSSFWRKHQNMKLLRDGSIIGVSVPTNNTAMAFYMPTDRCWWIGARFNHGSAPATGTSGAYGINSGLVMSSNSQGRSFLLAKVISREASTNKIDMFYNINGFAGIGTVSLSQTPGSDIIAKLAVSGKRMSVYSDDTLLGSANGVIPMGDRRFGGILMSGNNKASEFSFGQRPERYAHFSVDDVGQLMKRISESSLTSIYQNETFAFLQDMHKQYGLTVTLNLFYSINDGVDWNLSSFPDTFKSELTNANYWLKFAFHGGDESIRYNSESNNAAALASYSSFVTQVSRFASLGSIDLMPRLTYFSGNKTLLNSLYETKMFLGCLTADDDRVDNCGLNDTERDAVNGGCDYIDFANNLYYVRSRVRFDTQTTEQVTAMISDDVNKKQPVLEYFTHGANGFTEKDSQSIESMCQLMVAHGIRMNFAMNNMPF